MKKDEFVKEMIALGWNMDRYGHLQKERTTLDGEVRLWRCKLQATSCRLEQRITYAATTYSKAENAWIKMYGDYYKNIQMIEGRGIKVGRIILKKSPTIETK